MSDDKYTHFWLHPPTVKGQKESAHIIWTSYPAETPGGNITEETHAYCGEIDLGYGTIGGPDTKFGFEKDVLKADCVICTKCIEKKKIEDMRMYGGKK